jgi:hypothetical protein
VDLLQQRGPKHLGAAQAAPTRVDPAIPDEIALHKLSELGMRVQNLAPHLQLSGMLMDAPRGHERQLDFSELAHRFTPQFGDSCLESKPLQLRSYTNRDTNWDGECANSFSIR